MRSPVRRTVAAAGAALAVALVAAAASADPAAAVTPARGGYFVGDASVAGVVVSASGRRLVVAVSFPLRACGVAGARARVPRRLPVRRDGSFAYSGPVREASGGAALGTATVRGRFLAGGRVRVLIRHRRGGCAWRATVVHRRDPAGRTRRTVSRCRTHQRSLWVTPDGRPHVGTAWRPDRARRMCWPPRTFTGTFGARREIAAQWEDLGAIESEAEEAVADLGVTFTLVDFGARGAKYRSTATAGNWRVGGTSSVTRPATKTTCEWTGGGALTTNDEDGMRIDLKPEPMHSVWVGRPHGLTVAQSCLHTQEDGTVVASDMISPWPREYEFTVLTPADWQAPVPGSYGLRVSGTSTVQEIRSTITYTWRLQGAN